MNLAQIDRRVRPRAAPWLAVLAALAPAAALGQYAPIVTAPPSSGASFDPVDTLSMHLRTLAAQPRNLAALLGAGNAALSVGDPNAALGFFARADQVDARSGRAKAGLGAALVMLERADDALPLFAQAVTFGVPEADIARDRGLAYDLRGDSRRAQRDYALALRKGADDETTRRYALSLGISGDRAAALTLLDPLLRKKDQSAWRARAFILAMTGDTAGANGIARAVMPANLAQTMSPFLARLPKLNAAERAHAVNFGTMPATGQSFASVQIGDPFRPVGSSATASTRGGADEGLVPAGDPLGPRAAATPAQPLSRQPRRRPGREALAAAKTQTDVAPGASVVAPPANSMSGIAPAQGEGSRLDTRVGRRIAAVDPAKLPPEARGEPIRAILTARTALPPPSSAAALRDVIGPPTSSVAAPQPAKPQPAAIAPQMAKAQQAAAVPEVLKPQAATIAPEIVKLQPAADRAPAFDEVPRASAPLARAASPPAAASTSRLAAILTGIVPEAEAAPAALPSAAEIRTAKRAAQRKAVEAAAAATALKAQQEAKLAEEAAAKRNPARLWVQIATGNNARGLPGTWSRIRDGNANALKARSAWSVPFKATNRLLVGPMKSPADARALVNALAKGGVAATTFASEAGQEVARLSGK